MYSSKKILNGTKHFWKLKILILLLWKYYNYARWIVPLDPDGPATAPTAPNVPPHGILIFTIFIQKIVISIEKYFFCINKKLITF